MQLTSKTVNMQPVAHRQVTRTGQHDRTPVTTKHEKRIYANLLFAVSYGSFQGRPLHSNPLRGVIVSPHREAGKSWLNHG